MRSDNIHEDEHWEFVRESLEAPRKRHWWDVDPEPELEEKILDIDDIADEIEIKLGPLEKIDEYDLFGIVKKETGIDAVSAEFDRQLFCIFYKYEVA